MKVSYIKRFDNKGYVYAQTISMTQKEFDKLQDIVANEILMGLPHKDKYIFTNGYETFMQKLVLINNKICFMNLTQTRFVNMYLKLKLKSDRNTCIIIKGC